MTAIFSRSTRSLAFLKKNRVQQDIFLTLTRDCNMMFRLIHGSLDKLALRYQEAMSSCPASLAMWTTAACRQFVVIANTSENCLYEVHVSAHELTHAWLTWSSLCHLQIKTLPLPEHNGRRYMMEQCALFWTIPCKHYVLKHYLQCNRTGVLLFFF